MIYMARFKLLCFYLFSTFTTCFLLLFSFFLPSFRILSIFLFHFISFVGLSAISFVVLFQWLFQGLQYTSLTYNYLLQLILHYLMHTISTFKQLIPHLQFWSLCSCYCTFYSRHVINSVIVVIIFVLNSQLFQILIIRKNILNLPT